MRNSIKTIILLIIIATVMAFLLLVSIFGFLIDFNNELLEPKYEYETFDGEKGMALYCYPINRKRENPYCVLEDKTKVFDIKEFKKIDEGKE